MGVSLAERDHEGRTALHHAAFIGNLEVVRYLAAYGKKTKYCFEILSYRVFH